MSLNRRDLLRSAAVAGTLAAVWPLSAKLSPAQALEAAQELGASYDPAPFTLGVASGDPVQHGVSLWTRLAPEPLADEQPLPDAVEVHWVVATDRALRRKVAGGTVAATAAQGHSVHVDVHGLQPGRRYYYAFSALGRTSRLGRTRTAPAGRVDRVRFATANCQNFAGGYYSALRGIAREDVDFVVHLGDYIYENGVYGGTVRSHEGPEVFDLVSYRRRHALYKGDPDLRAAHAAHPWYLTWDNHEVQGYYDGRDDAAFLARRDAAYQAWYENMPHRMVGANPVPHQQIYRRRNWGSLLDLTILDLRQYRSRADRPDSTILGAKQRDWLLDQARDAHGWHCWANSIMLSKLDAPGGDHYYDMQWDGYRAERADVLTQLNGLGLEDFVVVTGDWHSAFVDDIRPDFTNPDSPVIGTEFTAHSVTSDSYGPEWNAARGPEIGRLNPHLQYFEGDRYGYDVHDVTARRWTTEMRVIADRRDPCSPVTTLTRFHVDRGRTGAYEDPRTSGSPAQYRRDPSAARP
ncbi:alkaline phosphatase D family protein [Streptomyces sp. NBC_01619]|uniref:alkaline phosphatase D family protein n=1 Tax=Streptomyces sp. NBC_01619 TaxID=2975901 RepID=UPI00224FBB46|nr:alkaline phosphatase D family protein [Streptomyces sp. NBC_01619]MCX4514556.1 alkaline phosphatase D family protein [Streptomyces sp. NBC_01619]